MRLPGKWARESFTRLLEQYEFLSEQIDRRTRLLKEPATTETYRERVKILHSVPGVGLITSMELLLKLQDVAASGVPMSWQPMLG